MGFLASLIRPEALCVHNCHGRFKIVLHAEHAVVVSGCGQIRKRCILQGLVVLQEWCQSSDKSCHPNREPPMGQEFGLKFALVGESVYAASNHW